MGRFPFPVPNGWFAVARAEEVAVGQVRPAHYFGKDLAVFRTVTGEARVVDAYCPHLGANLAIGGRVEGQLIECPFHAWRYDGVSGRCVDVPYTDAEPSPKAKVHAYPVIERFGLIFAWHHLGKADPYIPMPEMAEFDDAEWSDPVFHEFKFATCCQEMAENNADYVHFKYVHGMESVPGGDVGYDGFVKTVTERQEFKSKSGKVHALDFVRKSYGLGLGALRLKGVMSFVSSVTPVDTENVHIRWVFTFPRSMEAFSAKMINTFVEAIAEDVPIWENKIYVEKPLLIKGDGPIIEFRHWARQFYGEDVPASAWAPNRVKRLEESGV
ncbi:Rieske 2Fe-2S domain-containing protein [Actinocorallia sp. A-T 12471]|uniref:Rieske 2Fe-2S domain-containing protein n=1 Tax=Actinocorallia sp. A-T 12471 TaxID=3089813 RepID=UPI0029CCF9BA|nr:Rieske 2Fe-2S domain-containing protein [Actinocorallia sp. A-T 12471]MDX6740953.1 Rieske 2Fe-2S domain-containing protein [Actinocorallia sp. A-T 12471]